MVRDGGRFEISAGGPPTDPWEYPIHGSSYWAAGIPKVYLHLPASCCQLSVHSRSAALRARSGKRNQNLELQHHLLEYKKGF